MKTSFKERLLQLLNEPTYRTRLVFFLLVGLVIIFLAVFIVKNPFWADILVQFAVVFFAVAIIQFLWDFLGGDPMEIRINHMRNEFNAKFDVLHQATTVLADITNNNIGLERIWPDRRIWQHDLQEGLAIWKSRLCAAKQVDIVSTTFLNNWIHDEKFRHQLFTAIEHGTKVRVVIYDPKSEIMQLRASDEGDPHGQMQNEAQSTLFYLAQKREKLKPAARSNFEIRLTTQFIHLAQIIRADAQMLVTLYLSGKTGSPAPTLKLRGVNTTYFITYLEQFTILWERARVIDDDEFRLILHNQFPKDL